MTEAMTNLNIGRKDQTEQGKDAPFEQIKPGRARARANAPRPSKAGDGQA